jgi:hypothetical protein
MAGINRRIRGSHVRIVFVAAVILAGSWGAMAQRARTIDNLPDAPAAKDDPNRAQESHSRFKTTMGVLGKRSLFFPELAFDSGPLGPGKKLRLAIDETSRPSSFMASAFTAGIGQARNSLPGYGQEWGGYGKRFGSSVASNVSSHLFGVFLLPSALHQDPRYFVKLSGTPGSRVIYAMERVVVTRTDAGRGAFNWSGLMGGLMAEGLADSYLPDGERSAGKTFSRFGIRVGFGVLNNVVKEYWPTIFRSLRIAKIVPSEGSDPGIVTPPPNQPSPKLEPRRLPCDT